MSGAPPNHFKSEKLWTF